MYHVKEHDGTQYHNFDTDEHWERKTCHFRQKKERNYFCVFTLSFCLLANNRAQFARLLKVKACLDSPQTCYFTQEARGAHG